MPPLSARLPFAEVDWEAVPDQPGVYVSGYDGAPAKSGSTAAESPPAESPMEGTNSA